MKKINYILMSLLLSLSFGLTNSAVADDLSIVSDESYEDIVQDLSSYDEDSDSDTDSDDDEDEEEYIEPYS